MSRFKSNFQQKNCENRCFCLSDSVGVEKIFGAQNIFSSFVFLLLEDFFVNTQKLAYIAQKNPNLIHNGDWKLLCSDFSSEINPSLDNGNLVPVNYAATGFMLIKTAVLKAMAKHYPNIKYRNDIDGYMEFGDNFYDFFPAKVNPKSLNYDNLLKLLKGHEGYPKSICSHYKNNSSDPSATCGGALGSFTENKYHFWRGCETYDENYVDYNFKLRDDNILFEQVI